MGAVSCFECGGRGETGGNGGKSEKTEGKSAVGGRGINKRG